MVMHFREFLPNLVEIDEISYFRENKKKAFLV